MFSPTSLLIQLALLILTSASQVQQPLQVTNNKHNSTDPIAKNAPQILNTLLSSLRQFPASIHHNGMSFFPASIPEGTLMYHGTHVKERVNGMEWLAFEIEHAEMFAHARRVRGPRPPPGEGGGPPPSFTGRGDQEDRGPPPPSHHKSEQNQKSEEESHGYLHIYQTHHALKNLLYIDGMSAAKCPLGTLDTTDYILLNGNLSSSPRSQPGKNGKEDQDQNKRSEHLQKDTKDDPKMLPPTHPNSDYARAQSLCLLATEWGLEGFIRMEAGFELILCDFSAHVDLISANQRPADESSPPPGTPPGPPGDEPGPGDRDGEGDITGFEYLRGLEQRYNGITAGRIVVDYSRMISAFFYPELNLTNPDPSKGDLSRLPKDDVAALAGIKSDIGDLFLKSKDKTSKGINWQGIADMISTRYTTRLPFLAAPSTLPSTMKAEIGILLNVFIDYENMNLTLSRENCAVQYLRPITPTTRSDQLISSALLAVTTKICNVLFDVREDLASSSSKSSFARIAMGLKNDSVEKAKAKIEELMSYLNWATWRECGKCEVDEVCYVAIWPWGGVEDHEKPSCVKASGTRGRRGYWNTEF